MTPKRIQMSRQHPWRMENPDAIVVDRRTKWGNPFKVGEKAFLIIEGGPLVQVIADRAHARLAFRTALTALLAGRKPPRLGMDDYPFRDLQELAGRDLACWCPIDQPCHADVLLELANPAPTPEEP